LSPVAVFRRKPILVSCVICPSDEPAIDPGAVAAFFVLADATLGQTDFPSSSAPSEQPLSSHSAWTYLAMRLGYSADSYRSNNNMAHYKHCLRLSDRLCGLVVRVIGYRSGGPGSIPGTTKKNVVGLERGPLSLVITTEELLDRKVAAPV
jgi:hypothetical protein